jgi:molecular chaperone GrpE
MPSSEPAAPVEPAPSQPSEADVLKDRLLRLQADFDNFRKRMARERQETIARANEDLLEALLTPVDHLDRALDVMQKGVAESDPCLQGVRLVRSELRAVLDRFGLKPIETQGKPFDPSIHESLGWASVAGVAEGHVAAEVRAGYLLNGRLLRAAQVMVGAAPAALPANDTTAAPDESAEG